MKKSNNIRPKTFHSVFKSFFPTLLVLAGCASNPPSDEASYSGVSVHTVSRLLEPELLLLLVNENNVNSSDTFDQTDPFIATRSLWQYQRFSKPIAKIVGDPTSLTAEELTTALSNYQTNEIDNISLGTGTILQINMTDGSSIVGLLEFRQETYDQINIYWSGIEARRMNALRHAQLPIKIANKIYYESINLLQKYLLEEVEL